MSRTDGVLTDRQRAAFGMLAQGQVEFCSVCHSGTRRVGGDVIHNQGCTKGDEVTMQDETTTMPPAPPDAPDANGTKKAAAPKKASTKKATATTKKATPPKKAAASKKKAPAAKKAAGTVTRSRAEAQARDEQVFNALKKSSKGMTREQLREASGAGDLTYMSLWRLHKASRVEKRTGVEGSKHPVWFAKG